MKKLYEAKYFHLFLVTVIYTIFLMMILFEFEGMSQRDRNRFWEIQELKKEMAEFREKGKLLWKH